MAFQPAKLGGANCLYISTLNFHRAECSPLAQRSFPCWTLKKNEEACFRCRRAPAHLTAGFSGPKNLPTGLEGAPYPCPFGQHGGGGLNKSAVLHQAPSTGWWDASFYGHITTCVHSGQLTCWADWTKDWTCCPRAMYLQENRDYTLKWFRWFGRSLRGQRWTSSPQKTILIAQLISWSKMLWPMIGPALTFMPSLQLTCFLRSSGELGKSNARFSWWPHSEGTRRGSLSWSCCCQHPLGQSHWRMDPLPSERHDLASPAWAVEPSCLAPQWKSLQLSARVTNTIMAARALSMRCLYALKVFAFSDWCAVWNEDPSSCDVSSILTFLMDKGCTPSTIKVYGAAIVVNHALALACQSAKTTLSLNSRGELGDWICLVLILCRPVIHGPQRPLRSPL